MPSEPKKPNLTEEELDGVSGGVAPPEPDRLERGVGDPNIKIGIGDPNLSTPGLAEPPEPVKVGH